MALSKSKSDDSLKVDDSLKLCEHALRVGRQDAILELQKTSWADDSHRFLFNCCNDAGVEAGEYVEPKQPTQSDIDES